MLFNAHSRELVHNVNKTVRRVLAGIVESMANTYLASLP